jgi:hypothetical protein
MRRRRKAPHGSPRVSEAIVFEATRFRLSAELAIFDNIAADE